MKKDYRVSPELKKYVRRILLRSFYTCHMYTDEEGQDWCATNCPSDSFHRIVQRAKCEKASEESGNFYVTAKEACNQAYLTGLMEFKGVQSYTVIDSAKCNF